jgi:hypothetical protein
MRAMERNPEFLRSVSKVVYPFLFQVIRHLSRVTGESVPMPRTDLEMWELCVLWTNTSIENATPEVLVQNMTFDKTMVVALVQTFKSDTHASWWQQLGQ